MTFAEWCDRWRIPPDAVRQLMTLYRNDDVTPGSGSESVVQSALRIEAARLGHALWRNNSGAMIDNEGRMVRYGLGNDSQRLNKVWKSSDLIGITFGRFTAVEVKAPGWRGPSTDHEKAQAAFLANVNALGGLGFFATCVEDYHAAIATISR